jgi:hypothetical protein
VADPRARGAPAGSVTDPVSDGGGCGRRDGGCDRADPGGRPRAIASLPRMPRMLRSRARGPGPASSVPTNAPMPVAATREPTPTAAQGIPCRGRISHQTIKPTGTRWSTTAHPKAGSTGSPDGTSAAPSSAAWAIRPETPTTMARLSVCSASDRDARSKAVGIRAPRATIASIVSERSSMAWGSTWTATSVGTAT